MENDCIFCRIVEGKLPSHKVYEDGEFLAFLSIDPTSPGHTLIIPKKHYRWVWDVPNAGDYFVIAKKIALAQKKAFDTDFILSKVVGDEVPHAHIWIYPDREIVGDKKDFAGNAKRIKNALV